MSNVEENEKGEKSFEKSVEDGLTKAIFGSRIRPEIFEKIIEGRMTIKELAEKLEVTPATVISCINPLLPYRVIDVSVGRTEKAIGLGPAVKDIEGEELVGKLAENVIDTKKTIAELAKKIAEKILEEKSAIRS